MGRRASDAARARRKGRSYFTATGAQIVHGGAQACYVESSDLIKMLPVDCFADAGGYHATLAHEAVQRTKHKRRLARDLGRKRWGDEGYAMEELVAELGAALVCAGLGLSPGLCASHASYLAS